MRLPDLTPAAVVHLDPEHAPAGELDPETPAGRNAVQQCVGREFAHTEQHVVEVRLARPVEQRLPDELAHEGHRPALTAVERLTEGGELC